MSEETATELPRGIADIRKYQFKPGQSGNPHGYTGPRAPSLAKLRAWLAKDSLAVITKVVEEAKAGNMVAAKLVIERLLPAYRAAECPAAIPGLGGSLTETSAAVIAAVGKGDLAPSQAAQLLVAISSQTRVLETEELRKRIAELKAKSG